MASGFLAGMQEGSGGGLSGVLKKLKKKLPGQSKGDAGGDGSDAGGFYGSDLTSYHKGGTVRKTGPARLRKGERVLTKTQSKRYRKVMGRKR